MRGPSSQYPSPQPISSNARAIGEERRAVLLAAERLIPAGLASCFRLETTAHSLRLVKLIMHKIV